MTIPKYNTICDRRVTPNSNPYSSHISDASRDVSVASSRGGQSCSTATSADWVDRYVGALSSDDELMFEMESDHSRSPSPLNLPPPHPALTFRIDCRTEAKVETKPEYEWAANNVGRRLRITSSGRVQEVQPARVTFASPICLTEHNGNYRLHNTFLPLPKNYPAMQADARGLYSLALNVLCGAGSLPLNLSAAQMLATIEAFVAQLLRVRSQSTPATRARLPDAMHQPL